MSVAWQNSTRIFILLFPIMAIALNSTFYGKINIRTAITPKKFSLQKFTLRHLFARMLYSNLIRSNNFTQSHSKIYTNIVCSMLVTHSCIWVLYTILYLTESVILHINLSKRSRSQEICNGILRRSYPQIIEGIFYCSWCASQIAIVRQFISPQCNVRPDSHNLQLARSRQTRGESYWNHFVLVSFNQLRTVRVYLLDSTFICDRYHHSSAVVIPVKYERDSTDIVDTLARYECPYRGNERTVV